MEEQQAQEKPEQPRYTDYFVLETGAGDWMISRNMAVFVEGELERWPRGRWIRFIDLTGASIRVRVDLIRALRQSSAVIRGEWRRFKAERQQEAPDEPSDWEVDW